MSTNNMFMVPIIPRIKSLGKFAIAVEVDVKSIFFMFKYIIMLSSSMITSYSLSLSFYFVHKHHFPRQTLNYAINK